MLFLAFMDTSGKLADSKYVVTAGVLFYQETAGEFAPAWDRLITKAAIRAKRRKPRYLHMKDANRLHGEFKGWKRHTVDELLIELAKLTREYAFELFAAPSSTTKYKALSRSEQDKLKGPEELAFEVCISGCEQAMGKEDQLGIYCDDDDRTVESFAKFVKRKKLRDPSSRDRIIQLTFADDRFYPALQAADMLAYVEREEMVRQESESSPSPSPLYLAINEEGAHTIEYAWERDGKGWGHAVRIES